MRLHAWEGSDAFDFAGGSSSPSDTSDEMQSELEEILDKAGKHGAKAGIVADDLTAMVVRLREDGSA